MKQRKLLALIIVLLPWSINAQPLSEEQRTQLLQKYSALIINEPTYVNYAILGRLHYQAGNMEQAEHYYSQSVALYQDLNVLHEYANTLSINNKFSLAISLYEYLSKLFPQNSKIIHNLGHAYKELGAIDTAIALFDKAIAKNPELAEAHVSRSMAYLKQGDFLRGWPEYEWRWQQGGLQARAFKQPLWNGEQLNGKRILLYAEQGLGDTFQFIRYAKIAKERGGYVIAQVQDPLIDILSLCPYIDKLVKLYNYPDIPPFDYQAGIMSLPGILKTTVDTIPLANGYLTARADLVQTWKEYFATDKQFKVGVCWQGNAYYKDTMLQVTVMYKSIKTSMLQPICDMPGVSVYSLQKMTGTDHPEDYPTTLKVFGEQFDKDNGRFMDTAAVIANMDLVITIDTSIAHLAAALGKPTWVLLPEPADWRWLLNRSDTPWYTSMKLFRQPTPGNWQPVLDTITAELAALIERTHDQTHIITNNSSH